MRKKFMKWVLSKSISKQDKILLDIVKTVIDDRRNKANSCHKKGDATNKSWHEIKDKINSI